MSDGSVKFVGSIPDYYDKGLGPNLFHYYGNDIAARVVSSNPENVLELAAGTGIVTRRIRDALNPNAVLIATDLNQPMLDVAAKKFGEDEDVSFEPADALDLPFGGDTFDVVVCQFGVMFFPDKPQSYREAKRVLKPGGSYIFNVWCGWDKNPFARVAHETVAKFYDGNPPVFYKIPFGYFDVDDITKSLLDAGFKRVKADIIAHTVTIHNVAEFSKAAVFGNPISAEILERGGNPDEAVAAIENALRCNFKDGTMPLEAIVFTATT